MSGPRHSPRTSETLTIGWVYPGDVNGLFMQSVTNYILDDGIRGRDSRMGYGRGGTIGLLSGPRIAHGRNLLVNSFLRQTKAEWLLMVDTDMVFTTKQVDQLFAVADPESCPIVGGLCFNAPPSGVMSPTLYVFCNPEENEGNPIRTVWDYPEGLCEVDGTGAAFLLMHRGALEKMGQHYSGTYPWFAEGTVYHGIMFGEDMAFCARAKNIDIPIYVNTKAKIGHVKPQIMDEDAYKSFRQVEAEIGIDAFNQKVREKIGMEKV